MSNKLRVKDEGLAVKATIASVLEANTLVKITGDNTVDKAAAGDVVFGVLVKPAKTPGGSGTVEARYDFLVEMKLGAALTAGARVKLGAADGSGNQTVVAWVAADGADLLLGIVWKGGASGATGEILVD